jgi:cell wall-associated NlpC family hydrolase
MIKPCYGDGTKEVTVDLDKFIGIRHHFGRHGFDGADCIGLCRLFYEQHGYKESLDDKVPIGTYEDYQRTPLRILRYLLKNFDKVHNPHFGDIIVSKVCNELHLGIYIDYGKVLAMSVPCIEGVTTSTIYREEYWKPSLIQAFRRRS